MSMNFSATHLVIISTLYLLIMFGVAWLSENIKAGSKLTSNPVVYILSLGVYNSAWTFYGIVALASYYGYGYLAISLGFTGAFLLVPVLLYPLLKLTQTYQLSSLADLFSFRFRSRWAGVLTCLFMLIGMLPLLALQIRAVTHSVTIITDESTPSWASLVFCCLLIVFAVLFGSRQISIREKRTGLVVAIAFESVVKLVAFLGIGLYVVYGIFNGFDGLSDWLMQNREALKSLHTPLNEGPWRTLLLSFFAATIVMPHMFHMTFSENVTPKALMMASWAVPLYLLLMAFSVPLILWGGLSQNLTIAPDYFVLGIGISENSVGLTLLAYVGGLAAASGLIIVSTIALSGMILNHLILPFYVLPSSINIYRWLKWVRRTLIVLIILLGYLFYLALNNDYSNSELGITACIATLQFFPGVLSLLYWKAGNRKGFIAGLLAGIGCWFVIMLIPLVTGYTQLTIPYIGSLHLLGASDWHTTSTISLAANVLVFMVVSLLTHTSEEEKYAADLCAVNTPQNIQRREVVLASPQEFIQALEAPLGIKTARKEVESALNDLTFSLSERRPYALRQLRDRIEVNLSGLIGPHLAQQIVDKFLPYQTEERVQQSEDIYFIESRLESYETRLTGLAAELDALRRYHRLTLQTLPIGVCSLSRGQDILLWNRAMEVLTDLLANTTIGANVSSLPIAWCDLLTTFMDLPEDHLYKQRIDINGHSRWYNLHKASIGESVLINSGGAVILIEDITETYLLEDRLIHSERLASIGRLAAGVAHEIGNPVTGIACLAQILRDEWAENQDVVELSGQVIEQTKRISKIVQSLMNFAHAGGQIHETKAVSLFEVTQETVHLLTLNKEKKRVQFENYCDPEHKVAGNPQRLTQVFINLLSNARDASNVNGIIKITSYEYENTIELRIEDEGEGIPDELKARIFEPFFTTKEPGVGTGLGLALVYSIIEDHYGKITVTSPANPETKTGTCFSIILPRYVEHTMV